MIYAVIMVFVSAVVIGGSMLLGPAPGAVTSAVFHIGDCYHHAGPIKRWEPKAAGMIFDMDAGTYLVVPYLGMRVRPVDRWVYGHERSIELFDREHVKVDCLEEWK